MPQDTTMRHIMSRREFLTWTASAVSALSLLPYCSRAAEKPLFPIDLTSLDAKIGQMLMVGFRGLTVSASHTIVQQIQALNLGGIVLFDQDLETGQPVRNIQSPEQVRQLIYDLQTFAPTPLLIGIDYEGGQVNRLKEAYGFPPTHSHAELGRRDDLEYTYAQAAQMAQTLASLGISINLAPVVDLNVNPMNPIIGMLGRSFSADPNVVIRHARAFIEAHHDHGILCALKHFPGHGSSTTDTHLDITDVTETWSPIELEPYRSLIESHHADAVMTAHVFNAKLDPHSPATLSSATIDGILRREMGYTGVVFSDDMQMRAITEHVGFEMAIQQAVLAGVDMIVIGNNSGTFDDSVAARAIMTIRQLVHNGVIDETRIEESYQRLQAMKQRSAPPMSPPPPPDIHDPTVISFPETGHTLRGIFRSYWEAFGGLARFGYPLTEPLMDDGLLVQYFERARFEEHPEHRGTPDEVLLTHLGTLLTQHRHHEPAFERTVVGERPGRFVPETGHHLAPQFQDAWDYYGGLSLNGYPISEAFEEVNADDGQTYLVQYFERARFEYHPEHRGTPYEVLLGMLGAEYLRIRMAS